MHAECPESWWEFSFETAIHVYNRTPLRRTNWTTPFQNIYGNKPDVQYFKTFGCLAWVYKPKETCKNKLDNRSEPMTSDLKLISSCVKIPRYLLPHMPGLTKRSSLERSEERRVGKEC